MEVVEEKKKNERRERKGEREREVEWVSEIHSLIIKCMRFGCKDAIHSGGGNGKWKQVIEDGIFGRVSASERER